MSLSLFSKGGALLSTSALTLGLILQPTPAYALDNGAARTPPMGWSSWNTFGCDIDQWKIKGMADAMIIGGLRAAGYVYVNIDDCWQAEKRLPNGELTWNKKRFPDGIPALARYIHSKGLKFGLYATPGTRGCAQIYDNYPGKSGSKGHEYQDARTFARWGVDYLKYDWCKADKDGLKGEKAFAHMRDAIQKTGRPMVYSIHHEPELPVRDWYPETANMWRTTPDIVDNWYSVAGIALTTLPFACYSRPGAWNDPDMLEIGNGGLNRAESISHMALWAMLAAPLIMGNDVRGMSKTDYWILANKVAIRIDQDRLGRAAHIVRPGLGMVLARPLKNGQWAVSLTNFGTTTTSIAVTLRELGLTGQWRYQEAFHNYREGLVGDGLRVQVEPHDTYLYLLIPNK